LSVIPITSLRTAKTLCEQFTVVEDRHHRRPDIVLFVNGLPLGVIELKNAAEGGPNYQGGSAMNRNSFR
jgi:type I site-specific restriction-modification system R (restriction) subunit